MSHTYQDAVCPPSEWIDMIGFAFGLPEIRKYGCTTPEGTRTSISAALGRIRNAKEWKLIIVFGSSSNLLSAGDLVLPG